MLISVAIRLSRRSRNLTQQELADRAGVSRQAIVLLESGAGRVSTLHAALAHAPIKFHNLPQPNDPIHLRLKASREANGQSIPDVARAAQISINTVKAVEAGGGTVGSLTKIMTVVAPRAKPIPWLEKPRKNWQVLTWKPNPDRNFADYYATPAPIARMLFDHEVFEGAVLEPAVGAARVIERVLVERGYSNITCFDIEGAGSERRDFFDVTEMYDSIITNPPFNRHVDFILHAKKLARDKIALLLPINYLTGKRRHADVWEDTVFPLARVLILNRGVNFLAGDPFAERVMPSQLYCAWFIWSRDHVGPPTMTWVDNDALIARGQATEF